MTEDEKGRAPGRGRVYASITDTIGDTPIVRIDRIAREKGVHANLLAKLEFFNPISSVKDRIGVSMIDVFRRVMCRLEPERQGIYPVWWLCLVGAIGSELFFHFGLFTFTV